DDSYTLRRCSTLRSVSGTLHLLTSVVPTQHALLHKSKNDSEQNADEAEQQNAAPHFGDQVVALKEHDAVPEPRRREKHLGDHHQNERDRQGLPHARHDAWARRRQDEVANALPPSKRE